MPTGQPFDFKNIQKIVFDGCHFGISKHFIAMLLKTGPAAFAFAILPEDLKNMQEAIGKTLKLYEETYGPIEDSNKPVPSPIKL